MDPGAIQSLLKIATPLIGAVGTGGGIWNNIQNAQYQNKLRSLASDPAKMMAYAKGFEQPLQAGLLKGVENQTQGYAAERGLATSPQIQQALVSQAIAPYLQQQQNQALDAAYKSLGLGGGAPYGGSTSDIASSLKMLQSALPGQAGPWAAPTPTPQNDYLSELLSQTNASLPYYQQDSYNLPTMNLPSVDQSSYSSYGPYAPGTVDMTSFGFGGG